MSKMLSWTFFASGNFLMIFGSWTRMFSTLSQLSSAVQWMMQNTFVSCAMNFHETTLDEAWNLQKFSQTTGGGGAAVTTDWGFSAKVIFRWSVKKWSFAKNNLTHYQLGNIFSLNFNSVRKGYQSAWCDDCCCTVCSSGAWSTHRDCSGGWWLAVHRTAQTLSGDDHCILLFNFEPLWKTC